MTAAAAHGDELVLTNGDRLTGTVVKLVEGTLTFRSALAGTVSVAVGSIRSLSTEQPVTAVLHDGTVLREPLRPAPDGGLLLGERPVALTDLQALNPPDTRWTGNATLGLSFLRSNDQSDNLNFLLGLNRDAGPTAIAVDANYQYSRQDGDTTANTGFAGADYRFGRQRQLYGYVSGSLKYDEIQNLDLRSILGAGVGFHWVRRPEFNLRSEGGLSWVREEFAGMAADDKLTLRLAYFVDRGLWQNARLKHDLALYPNLSAPGDFYLLTTLGIEQTLAGNWYGNARIIYDYTARPPAEAKRSTSQFIFGVGKRF